MLLQFNENWYIDNTTLIWCVLQILEHAVVT